MNCPDQSFDPSNRTCKETLLGQRGLVIWLYGLSGAGKTTLARALECRLAVDHIVSKVLDGDELRNGINKGLGFDDEARAENIRRSAETARLFLEAGFVTICAFICPKRDLRKLASSIIGADDFMEVYVKASYEGCARRDVKGLYEKARKGEIPHFTGRDSSFEEPEPGAAAIIIESERQGIARCVDRLLSDILPRVKTPVP